MSDPTQEQLLGYLLGALDDSQRESIDARLEREPDYRRELERARRLLQPLDAARQQFPSPPGLAERTCDFVFDQSASPAPLKSTTPAACGWRSMSPEVAPPNWVSRVGWLDVAMAATVFVAAALLTIPAIQHSRFHARVTACQDNLQQLGLALTQYSENNSGYFPLVPTEGKLAAAGVYAPALLREGLLTEVSRVLCPDSCAQELKKFQVPTVDQLQAAAGDRLHDLQRRMGGSYGYCFGYASDGAYRGTKNLRRDTFALMADAPSADRPDYQTDNHGGRGQNVLFEDGHVRYLVTPHPGEYGDDFFCNDYGDVAAGVHSNDSVIGSSGSAPVIYVNR